MKIVNFLLHNYLSYLFSITRNHIKDITSIKKYMQFKTNYVYNNINIAGLFIESLFSVLYYMILRIPSNINTPRIAFKNVYIINVTERTL